MSWASDTQPVGERVRLVRKSSDDEGADNVPRKRWEPADEDESALPPDWNPDLPYGGKVFLARRKKPDPWWVTALEVVGVIFVIWLAYYSYYYFDHLHFHVTHAYAHMGYPQAQHVVAHRYLEGKGVDKHEGQAMKWFKKAADQGHAHASYNLAIGHVRGMRSGLQQGEAHRLIAHAAQNGVKEAHDALNTICLNGGCN